MKKLYKGIFSAFIFVLTGVTAFSQTLATSSQTQPSALTLELSTRYQANHKRAMQLAKQNHWDTVKVLPNGGFMSLEGVTDLGTPIYLAINNNVIAAATTRTNTIQTGGSLGLSLSGSSTGLAGKLGIWDGSTVYAAHQEFAGKTITNRDASTVAFSDHSTHVAGTMIAKGAYAPAKGMSYGATTLQSFDFTNELTEMSAAATGLLVSNHSYGYTFGWEYDGTNWTWYGLPGDTEDYEFGQYNSTSVTLDQIAVNSPNYLMVFAAGNARGYNGPAVGSTYYGYTSRTNFTVINKGARPSNISSQTGYDNLDSHAVAKNVLVVGAVNPLPNGPSSSSDVVNASFSSWGPTDDGRIKPDISGMGVNVTSSVASAVNAYGTLSGTSMATPNVSGSIFMLQEYWSQKNSGAFMRSATLRALVCHTALDAGTVGPDYVYGWGLLDMGKAAQAITDATGLATSKAIISEKTLSQGQTQTFNVVSSGSGPVVATIAWTDPAGSPINGTTINDRTIKLVNDLDIRVSDGTTTYKPWILDPISPASAATTGDNIRDNIEQVYIGNNSIAKAYTITVTHKGTLTNASQNYSLVVTGVGGSIYCASGPTSSADSRVNNVTISNLNNTPGPGCTTYSNFNNLSASLEQGKTYPLSVTVGTCGADFSKIAKVWIDWNGNGTFDANELVATSPVLASTGTFIANVAVPNTVVPGSASLMRVVLVETTDPTAVTPCGTYGKGETQDYSVQFILPTNDAGITAVNAPTANGVCQSTTSPISIKIKNYGSATLTNVPVTVTVTAVATNVVSTYNEVYTGSIASQASADFTLAGTFNAAAGATYTIAATTNLTGDQNAANNSTTASAVINVVPAITVASAAYCTDLKLYNLSATANGTVFWYKNIGDALPFTSGASVNTAIPPVSGSYYAGVNDFSTTIGASSKSAFSAGNYDQFGPSMLVSTRVPVIIQSARLYIGNSGSLTFTATNSAGIVVSSTTLNVTATRTTPGAGTQTNDAADLGKVYNLNLVLPTAGSYALGVTFNDAATIFRNNGGVTGYPFTANGIFNITGSNAVSTTAPTDTTYGANFYYYFYNMQVKSLDCIGGARIAVALNKPSITLTGAVMNSNFTTNNQWYLNGILIPGATSQTYTPQTSGIYRVDVTTVSGCVSKSDDFSFVLPAKTSGDGSDVSLAVFPVPATTQLHIAFVAPKAGGLTLLIKNAVGQSVYTNTQQITAGAFNTILNVSTLPDGVYFLEVKLDDRSYVRRITILR